MNEQQQLRLWESRCTQEEPPACSAGCPLGIDVRAFVLAMAKGNLKAARAVLDKSLPLPGIVGRLCEAPCETGCLRRGFGGAIAIGELEKFCITQETSRLRLMRIPAKAQKVRIIGSALSSLTAAWDLAKKGYQIEIIHCDNLCSWNEQLPAPLPEEALAEELSRLQKLKVQFIPVEQRDASLLEIEKEADACYIGYDDPFCKNFPFLQADPITFALSKKGFFGGGKSENNRFIDAISQGREAAISIDRFLQQASLTSARKPLRHGKTNLQVDTSKISPLPRTSFSAAIERKPLDTVKEKAQTEAARCIDCQCLQCVNHCEFLKHFGNYPRIHARLFFNNASVIKGTHTANTAINSCSLCGQCETICPSDFSMADLCLENRRKMVKEGWMPPSAHAFALAEMRHAQSEEISLLRHAPEKKASKLLFYPGCQLAATRLEQTFALYQKLLEIEPECGIWLDCCGIPAHWAGREEEAAKKQEQLQKIWQQMERPKIICACSSCLSHFRQIDGEIADNTLSLWNFLQPHKKNIAISTTNMPLAISDPCASRHDITTQNAVRTLLEDAGQQLAPLHASGKLTECCGYGGLMENANPQLARKVARARTAQSVHPLLTYCTMCREQLARVGAPSLHILDLLFPQYAKKPDAPPVTLSARRFHRRELKNRLLTTLYKEETMPEKPWQKIPLSISSEVEDQLDDRRILEDDIRQTLYQCEQEKSFFIHSDGRMQATARLGDASFWVEFSKENGHFYILRCWSHRMTATAAAQKNS